MVSHYERSFAAENLDYEIQSLRKIKHRNIQRHVGCILAENLIVSMFAFFFLFLFVKYSTIFSL